jgi:hypothetical protein
MPPSPIIKVTVNDLILRRVCEDLDIRIPLVKVVPDRKAMKAYGVAAHDGSSIKVFTNIAEYDTNQLRHVQSELNITTLHELRHVWQCFHEPGKFSRYGTDVGAKAWCEADAENYATEKHHAYRGLIVVKRRFPSTSIGKLAATEREVRGATNIRRGV